MNEYSLVADGQGHGYGPVPVYLWTDASLLNRELARPSRRDDFEAPPRPER